MASQWYCFTDEESGPHSFQDLAEMIARGELRESDLVRRQESRDWQRVDAVLGLLRTASQFRNAASSQHRQSDPGKIGGRLIASIEHLFPSVNAERFLIVSSLMLMAFFAVELGWMWWSSTPRFPPAPKDALAVQVPSRLQQLRPRPPATASIPGLPKGTPLPVPGFEHVTWLKSPTLSADMLSIVYVGFAGPGRLDELMIADRKRVTEPFTNHRSIQHVNSPLREAHPSLSPDGLQLMFVRQDGAAKIWSSRRPDRNSSFEAPHEMRIAASSPDEQHEDAPQFIDAKTIRITTGDTDFTQRSQWFAIRSDQHTFKLTGPVPIANSWPRYFITTRGRRAYLPAEDGLQLTALSTRSGQFVVPETLYGTEVVGPHLTVNDDTIWVSPAEDLIFYCSPGPGSTSPDPRHLWMIRF